MNIMLSPHFSLAEMVASETAAERGINNTPTLDIIKNLKCLCSYLEIARQTVRAHFGSDKVIVVTSGYRCQELNRAVGGVADSAHVLGLAADIHSPGIGQTDLTNFLADHLKAYDQIINEGTWTHLGLTLGTPRMQRLVAHFNEHGEATYSEAA